jgi:hypothetical protein
MDSFQSQQQPKQRFPYTTNYTTKVVQVTIFDTFGKEWMLKSRKMLSDGEDHRLSFDVHTLPSGVYYLRVTDDLGHADILKFIKL